MCECVCVCVCVGWRDVDDENEEKGEENGKIWE